jgi:catechol 2,3-dioxygenase-like lactoylglutathione lyase family enzyme
MILNVRHVALVVTDLEKAISLYRELGADLRSRDLEKGPFIENLLGIPNVVIETCKMHFNDNSRLELIKFITTPNFSPTGQDIKINSEIGLEKFTRDYWLRTTMNHIAFTVKDIVKSIKIIESYGGRLHTKPAISTTEHSKYAVHAEHAYIFDPFENLLHLAQDLEKSSIK